MKSEKDLCIKNQAINRHYSVSPPPMGFGRNLPSNNTICEVSERESEAGNDERSRTIKRGMATDLKNFILMTT